MNVSINPTYQCNLRCNFCYLGEKLSDSKTAQISDIDIKLRELSQLEPIDHIDLYGGEIQLLSEEYLNDLFSTIKKYYDGKINIITNLTKISPILLRDDVDVSVSFDFECRSGFKSTLNNMVLINKPIAVLMLASPCLIKLDIDYMINTLNSILNIHSVEIKPYSSNQYNNLQVSFTDYEVFIKSILKTRKLRPIFVNELNIQKSLNGTRNAFSDDHIYLTPSGNFGILDFDENDRELFVELKNLKMYFEWREKEKVKIKKNIICGSCKYLGGCLTEHYREVKSLEHSCNGFRHLLEWYEGTQVETESLSSNSANNRLDI